MHVPFYPILGKPRVNTLYLQGPLGEQYTVLKRLPWVNKSYYHFYLLLLLLLEISEIQIYTHPVMITVYYVKRCTKCDFAIILSAKVERIKFLQEQRSEDLPLH